MTIIDRLYEECNQEHSLQCGIAGGWYTIYQWDDNKRCYDEWISCPTAVDMLLRYFRAKCFEGELLDCDNIHGQVDSFYKKLYTGEMHDYC